MHQPQPHRAAQLADAERVQQLARVVVAVPGADAAPGQLLGDRRADASRETENDTVGVPVAGRAEQCTCVARSPASSRSKSRRS